MAAHLNMHILTSSLPWGFPNELCDRPTLNLLRGRCDCTKPYIRSTISKPAIQGHFPDRRVYRTCRYCEPSPVGQGEQML